MATASGDTKTMDKIHIANTRPIWLCFKLMVTFVFRQRAIYYLHGRCSKRPSTICMQTFTIIVSKNFAIFQKFNCTWNDVLVISNTFNEYKLSDYCNAKVSVTLKRRQTRRIFAQTFFIFSFLCSLLTPDIVGPTCYETACINLF